MTAVEKTNQTAYYAEGTTFPQTLASETDTSDYYNYSQQLAAPQFLRNINFNRPVGCSDKNLSPTRFKRARAKSKVAKASRRKNRKR
jgi:hypothetical protein